jgi:hypothetical protein
MTRSGSPTWTVMPMSSYFWSPKAHLLNCETDCSLYGLMLAELNARFRPQSGGILAPGGPCFPSFLLLSLSPTTSIAQSLDSTNESALQNPGLNDIEYRHNRQSQSITHCILLSWMHSPGPTDPRLCAGRPAAEVGQGLGPRQNSVNFGRWSRCHGCNISAPSNCLLPSSSGAEATSL